MRALNLEIEIKNRKTHHSVNHAILEMIEISLRNLYWLM